MHTTPTGNQLLKRLPPDHYAEFLGRMKRMSLESGHVLYQAQSEIEYSYFPTTGTLSAVVVLSTGDIIEVATVGREGMVGLPSFREENRSTNRVFCQVPGEVLCIETSRLERAAMQEGPLRKVLLQYQAAFMFQVSQSVACNSLHVLPERCCRWLLMTHDRVDGDEIRLTHEFLSAMLGVRRSSVTETLQELSRKGLIEYGRGKITIQDRQGMEDSACECFASVRAEYERLLK